MYQRLARQQRYNGTTRHYNSARLTGHGVEANGRQRRRRRHGGCGRHVRFVRREYVLHRVVGHAVRAVQVKRSLLRLSGRRLRPADGFAAPVRLQRLVV